MEADPRGREKLRRGVVASFAYIDISDGVEYLLFWTLMEKWQMPNIRDTMFILGPRSPEMEEVEAILKAKGLIYQYATEDGIGVNSKNEKEANYPGWFVCRRQGYSLVFVGCAMEDIDTNWVTVVTTDQLYKKYPGLKQVDE